jgi:predicted kinase
MAILIGLQGSGKSTFFRQRLAGTHIHVSKDDFRNARHRQSRQLRMIEDALASGDNVAVDNTNPAPEEWKPLIAVARRLRARVTGYWFPPDVRGSFERNAARPPQTRVPDVGIYATLKRLQCPRHADGFDELRAVRFDGAGGFAVTVMRDGPDGGPDNGPDNGPDDGSDNGPDNGPDDGSDDGNEVGERAR